MSGSGNRLELLDFVDLGLLLLAKLKRRKLGAHNKDFYDEFFTELDGQVRSTGRDPRLAFRQEVLNRALAIHVPKGGAIVDVGCGIGDTLMGIGEGWTLSGVEYASQSARAARARLKGKADIAVGAASALPFASGAAQGAICLEVIEHLEDDAAALRDIHRILVPGAVLIASVPYRHWFRQYLPLMGHFRHYRRQDFASLLERCGFEVVEYLPNCPGWSRLINYAYVACRSLAMAQRIFGLRVSPLEARLPWASRPLIESFTNGLHARKSREMTLDYAAQETSTFVVARKR